MVKKRRISFNQKEKWYKYNVIAIIVAFLLISGLSVGYAVLTANLDMSGTVTLRTDNAVRINGITNTFASCGTDVYNPKYTENSITVQADLPNLNCYVEYEVVIKNDTNFVMEIININDTLHNNPDVLYEFNNLEIGTLITPYTNLVFTIRFYYDPLLSALPINTQIGTVIEFEIDYANLLVNGHEYVSQGLVLLYDAKNNTGSGYQSNTNQWKDLIGNNDGTLVNNPTWHNGYLEFDGVDDKVKFKGNIPPVYTIIVTFEADFTNATSWTRLYSENPFPSLYINYASGVRTLRLYGHSIDTIFPNSTLSERKTQATLTFNGSVLSLYINGKHVSTLNSASNPSSVIDAYLGGRGQDNIRQFKGKMYNFMIYDRVLLKNEIEQNSDLSILEKAIPISTPTQLLKIGSGETVTMSGVNYVFAPNANYVVKNDLSISQNGLWNPNVVDPGRITTYDKIITVTDTSDGTTHYYQNQLYITKDNAIRDGLVLHYDSINNTGSGHSDSTLIWKDLKGSNDATLMNGVAWNGNKLTFDGINDKVQYAGTLPGNNYSMVVTVKPVLTGAHPRFFGENPYPTVFIHSGQSYRIGLFSHGLDQSFSPSVTPSTTVPTYIVITYDGTKITLYVNGVEISSLNAITNAPSMQYAYLGGRVANDRQYTGDIYDFMIYDRVLTNLEIERSTITNYYKYN